MPLRCYTQIFLYTHLSNFEQKLNLTLLMYLYFKVKKKNIKKNAKEGMCKKEFL